MALLREHNANAPIITTPWEELDGKTILETMENKDTLKEELAHLAAEQAAHDESHHHHHHEHDHEHHHEHEHEHHHDHHHEHDHEHHHDHHHEGEDCGHACNACGSEEKCKDENLALLTYMLQHNEHHAAELDEMADKLEKAGMADAAKQIREGVSDFQKGNMRLSLALTLVKEHLKEVK